MSAATIAMRAFRDRQDDLDHDKLNFLRKAGWRFSSELPGSYWLWSKSFPESKTQWRWKHPQPANGPEKVPNPPFIVNGATTETALIIESAWQALYDDDRPVEDDEQEE